MEAIDSWCQVDRQCRGAIHPAALWPLIGCVMMGTWVTALASYGTGVSQVTGLLASFCTCAPRRLGQRSSPLPTDHKQRDVRVTITVKLVYKPQLCYYLRNNELRCVWTWLEWHLYYTQDEQSNDSNLRGCGLPDLFLSFLEFLPQI